MSAGYIIQVDTGMGSKRQRVLRGLASVATRRRPSALAASEVYRSRPALNRWGMRRSTSIAIEPRSGAIGIAGEVQQGAPINEDGVARRAHLRGDSFRGPPGRTDTPDIQFVREAALDEVNECAVGRPQGKVAVEPGWRSEDGPILRSPAAVCDEQRVSGAGGVVRELGVIG